MATKRSADEVIHSSPPKRDRRVNEEDSSNICSDSGQAEPRSDSAGAGLGDQQQGSSVKQCRNIVSVSENTVGDSSAMEVDGNRPKESSEHEEKSEHLAAESVDHSENSGGIKEKSMHPVAVGQCREHSETSGENECSERPFADYQSHGEDEEKSELLSADDQSDVRSENPGKNEEKSKHHKAGDQSAEQSEKSSVNEVISEHLLAGDGSLCDQQGNYGLEMPASDSLPKQQQQQGIQSEMPEASPSAECGLVLPESELETQKSSSEQEIERETYQSPSAKRPIRKTYLDVDVVQLLAEDRYWCENRTRGRENSLLRKPRPTPSLRCDDDNLMEGSKIGQGVSVSAATYQKIPWLTGSKNLGKHFCWPCLLFSEEKEKWSLPGNLGWKESSVAILNHQVSPGHVSAFKVFKLREEMNDPQVKPASIPMSVESTARIPTIHQNRRLLELLIRILCRKMSHPNDADLGYDGYGRLMKVAVDHYPLLRASGDLTEGALVNFVSLHADKLLKAMEHFLNASVRRDIAKASHVCLSYEDTKNVVDKASLVAVIVRYVDSDGDVHEKFMKFVRIFHPRGVSTMIDVHTTLIADLKIKEKLLAVSLSGTVLPPRNLTEFFLKVKSLSPKSKYIHDATFKLKEFVRQALSHVESSFFQGIEDLSDFFTTYPGAVLTLASFVLKSNPDGWIDNENNFTHDMILTIVQCYPHMVRFFTRLKKKFWNDELVHQAPRFLAFLTSPVNKFLISLVSAILCCIGELGRAFRRSENPEQSTTTTACRLMRLKTLGPAPVMQAASDPEVISLNTKGRHRTIAQDFPKDVCRYLFDAMLDAALACINGLCPSPDRFYLPVVCLSFSHVNRLGCIMERYLSVTDNTTVPDTLPRLQQQFESVKAYEPLFHGKTLQERVRLMKFFCMLSDFLDLYEYLRFCVLITPPKPDSANSTVAKLKSFVKNKQSFSTSELVLFLEKDSISDKMKDSNFFDAVLKHYVKNYFS